MKMMNKGKISLLAVLFAEQLLRTVCRPEPGNVLLLIGVIAGLLVAGRWIERRLTGPPLPAAAVRAGLELSGRAVDTAAPSPRR